MKSESTSLSILSKNMASRFGADGATDVIDVLKQTAFKGDVSDAQLTALMIVADQYGLNPFTKEIYAFPDKQNGIIPVVGVDGWSRIINENPQFDGLDFEQTDEYCTCVIYRKDRNHPVKVTEYLSECLRPAFKNKAGYTVTTPWQSHPKRMLRHKALIQCARLAFGFTGIYDQDEAEVIAKSIDSTELNTIDSTARIVEPEKDVKYWPDVKFNEKKETWKNLILTKAKTIDEVVSFLETKGKLTDDQLNEIDSWGDIIVDINDDNS